ncbi:MAG: hypothetical protein M0Z32_01720 [Actinomycetota bacterium]|jgi:hypothetical protein|nr:hypothetical protein [Actinomycetota bacterium]MCL6092890.1 hypothetical protein [Actinomycetota bacterium]MDA8166462.1 hypothetical protein [Actinomycetota bacterium]
MKKKSLISITVIALIGGLAFIYYVAREPGNALSGDASRDTYTNTFTIQKKGKTYTIEGRKDTTVPTPTDAHNYDPNYNQWIGDPQTWAELKQVVGNALRTEREVMIYTNLDSQDYQNKLKQYFSGDELQKREEWINGEKQGEAKVRTIGAGISKMDYKGISVDGSQATVVVDVWSWAKYQDVKSGKIMNPSNARQHAITLTQNNDQWIITKDRWDFIPGYEP